VEVERSRGWTQPLLLSSSNRATSSNRAAEGGQGKWLGVTDDPGLWPPVAVVVVEGDERVTGSGRGPGPS